MTTPNTFDDELLALLFTTTADSPASTQVTTRMVTTIPTMVTQTIKPTTIKSNESYTTAEREPITKLTTPRMTVPTTVMPKTIEVTSESHQTSTITKSLSTEIKSNTSKMPLTTGVSTLASTINTPIPVTASSSSLALDKLDGNLSKNNNPTLNLLNSLFPLTRTTVTTPTTTKIDSTSIPQITDKTIVRKIKPIPKPVEFSFQAATETSVPNTKVIPKTTPTLASTSISPASLNSTSLAFMSITSNSSTNQNMSTAKLTSIQSSTSSTTTSTVSITQPTITSKIKTFIPTTEPPTTISPTTTILTTTESKTTTLITTNLVTTTSGLGDFIPVSIQTPEKTFKLPKPTKPKSTASALPAISISTQSTSAPAFIPKKVQSLDVLLPSSSLPEPAQKEVEPPKMSLEEVLAAMNIEPTLEPSLETSLETSLEPTLEPILETTLGPTTMILSTTRQQTFTTTSGLGDFVPVQADLFELEVNRQDLVIPITSKMTSTTSFPLLDFLDSILGPPKTTTSTLQHSKLPTHLPAPTIPSSRIQTTSKILSTTSSIANTLNTDLQDSDGESGLPLGGEDYGELDFPPIIQNLLEPLDTGTMWMSTTLVAIETTTFPTTTSFVSYTVPTIQPVDQVAIPTPTRLEPTISTEGTVATTQVSPVIVGNPVTTESTTTAVNNRIQINNSTTNSTSILTSRSNSMLTDCRLMIIISFFNLVF